MIVPAKVQPLKATDYCAVQVPGQLAKVFRDRKPHQNGGKKMAALKGGRVRPKYALFGKSASVIINSSQSGVYSQNTRQDAPAKRV
jgi:hypothetical protein